MANPIMILLVGIVIVVGGIIGFKLHPLALLLAAVALLTPIDFFFNSAFADYETVFFIDGCEAPIISKHKAHHLLLHYQA
jgi:hypothetical protein